MTIKASTLLSVLAAGALVLALPLDAQKRDACPQIHIFGARNTKATPGYGLAGAFIDDIKGRFPAATAEAIIYPANGTANNHDATYAASVQAGVKNVTAQVSDFAQRCPNTAIVLVGYSQGAKIFDDALCGGGDPHMGIDETAPTIAKYNIKAVLLPGDDRFTPGEPFHVGNATHGGFDARPSDQIHCGDYDDRIQLYCDAEDMYCSNGTSLKAHNGYHGVYGQTALDFVTQKLGGV